MGAMTTIRMALSGEAGDIDAFLAAHVRPASGGGHTLDFDTLLACDHSRSWEGMYEAWGCRSHGWDFEVVTRIPTTVELRFEVKGAEARAEPVLAEIARRYPGLFGTFAMVPDTETWAAQGLLHEGKLHLQEAEWTEAMYALVEGHAYGEAPGEED
ncbi:MULTISPECIES: hypothetical protein [unclassified Methylobacterium]|uniref:hypothetical protein n=1 Tax=unclassified Methylobacterium TaxID=2615210 RepID=UPI0005B817FD|nr:MULTISPECIES: hypothetical protein [unclassified Methylobacterium]SFU50356.1 hypothetical protein SAMN02799643_00949 [Methylobacterium sp. UNCCL125]